MNEVEEEENYVSCTNNMTNSTEFEDEVAKGSFINHVATKGEAGSKISQNWLRYRCKIVYVRGEGGPKSPKKWLHGL